MSEPAITYTDLAIAFCKVFDLSERDLHKPGCRHLPFVRIRWALWTAARDAGYSYSIIGRKSGRDHSTVLHGIDRFAVLVHDREFLRNVEAAKLLAPEIASHRATGGRIDLAAPRQQAIAQRLSSRKPGPWDDVPDEDLSPDDYERRMRWHCQKASQALGEALREEVGG